LGFCLVNLSSDTVATHRSALLVVCYVHHHIIDLHLGLAYLVLPHCMHSETLYVGDGGETFSYLKIYNTFVSNQSSCIQSHQRFGYAVILGFMHTITVVSRTADL
jgi:hypothetical protein